MNDPLHTVKVKDMVRVLNKLGFIFLRQKGSHAFYYHPDGRRTVVPIHPGDLPKPVFHEILKQVDLTAEEIKKYI